MLLSKATYKGVYSSFLVLMTTQSPLQYSFTFTQSHTYSYSASISSTLLFYEAQFGVQHLAQGHFGMQICWVDWGSKCRPSGWRTTTLPRQPQPPLKVWLKGLNENWLIGFWGTMNGHEGVWEDALETGQRETRCGGSVPGIIPPKRSPARGMNQN